MRKYINYLLVMILLAFPFGNIQATETGRITQTTSRYLLMRVLSNRMGIHWNNTAKYTNDSTFDAQTGILVFDDVRWPMVMADDGAVKESEYSSYLVCKNLFTGELLWETNITPLQKLGRNELDPKKKVINSILKIGNIIYTDIHTTYDSRQYTRAYDYNTGIIIWEKELFMCQVSTNDFGLFSDLDGTTVTCIGKEGNTLWGKPRKEIGEYLGYDKEGSTIFINPKEGYKHLYKAIDLRTGDEKWSVSGSDQGNLDEKHAVYNGDLYINDQYLYCYDGETGVRKWRLLVGVARNMFFHDNYVFITNEHLGIDCFDMESKEKLWSFQTDKSAEGCNPFKPKIVNDDLWIVSEQSRMLFMLNPVTGKVLNEYVFPDGIKPYLPVHTKVSDCIENSKLYLNILDEGFMEFSLPASRLMFAVDSETYHADEEEYAMDSKPIIINSRTYLPARYVTEPLGGQVSWDGEERKVTCKLVAPDNAETEDYKENVVELWIDKSTAKVNGKSIQIDPDNPEVVPTIIGDRTMVPMRFLAESLGCSVEWIAESKEIILTYIP